MQSIKDLKKRITTVKNTQQTTRAMKMVSAAKLRRAQEAIQNQRPYAKRIGELLRQLAAGVDFSLDGSPLKREREVQPGQAKKVLLVLVTSDRGLCGGFNSSVIKAGQRWMDEHSSDIRGGQIELSFAFVGRKGHDFFKTKGVKITAYYPDLGGKVHFLKARKLAKSLLELYTGGEVDEIKFIYNEFKNAATQKVVVEDFLPLTSESTQAVSGEAAGAAVDIHGVIIKPSLDEVVKELLSKHFAIQAFRVLLESQAGEHGARMSSMENATKNAGEMIRKLTLQFNKQRQAGITKELLEIIAGSESQKG